MCLCSPARENPEWGIHPLSENNTVGQHENKHAGSLRPQEGATVKGQTLIVGQLNCLQPAIMDGDVLTVNQIECDLSAEK